MSVYAVVDSEGIVVNTVLWDGKSEWEKPYEMELILCDSTSDCFIGGEYKDGVFWPPATREQSREDSIEEAEQTKISLMAEATSVINTLQDAVGLGMATEDEKNQLTAWQKYRVMLNRIDVTLAPDVSWPEKP